MKIKVNIPNFGEKYCSNNVECKLLINGYQFYKKGKKILHNEYGPAHEWKDGSYRYFINNQLHRLNKPACHLKYTNRKNYIEYSIFNKFLGITKKQFIKNLANALIPIQINNT